MDIIQPKNIGKSILCPYPEGSDSDSRETPQKPLEIGRFGPPPQKEGRSELGSEPLKLVRRFFFFFFVFVTSFDDESCAFAAVWLYRF